jgi:4'-phosphopantetheinyl transferase
MATTVFWNFVEAPSGGAEDFLSPAEQARLQAMRFDLRRQSFLAGRQAAKRLLQSQAFCRGLAATAISVDNTPGGAPFALLNGREIPGSLSLSHRADAAAAAFSPAPGITVGIDLEVVEGRSAAFVEDFFTAEECAFVQTLRATQRAAWVASVWSAKEAVLKALKVGLRVDSRAVSICALDGAAWQAGWQPLQAGGPALTGCSCRVWRRLWGENVLTLAVLAQGAVRIEDHEIILEQVPVTERTPR